MIMTAVEIFFEDLVHLGYIEYPDENLVQDRLKLALEIQKQQMLHFWQGGLFANESGGKNFETYYNETYKK